MAGWEMLECGLETIHGASRKSEVRPPSTPDLVQNRGYEADSYRRRNCHEDKEGGKRLREERSCE